MMQINPNVAIHSNVHRLPSRAIVPVNEERPQETFALPTSPLSHFEQAAKEQASRFNKVEGLDRLAQEAIDSYTMTQSLAADNPRNYLMGVDVFA
ncbi:hypothetical protein CBF23_004415 [Marinomonas agarivorans]|nr:hypothetical protein CBF23_004415 [Marinomonas agarivorans]